MSTKFVYILLGVGALICAVVIGYTLINASSHVIGLVGLALQFILILGIGFEAGRFITTNARYRRLNKLK